MRISRVRPRRNSTIASTDLSACGTLHGHRIGAPEAADTTRRLLAQQRAILARFGALHVMSFRGVSSAGDDMYGLRFADGSAVWQIGLTEDKRIRSIALYP